MYSYQHRYHAGGFADVHKHVILIGLIQTLQKKSTPFAVLDAFAGEGLYDLNAKESQQVAEHVKGIDPLFKYAPKNAPALITSLLEIINRYNTSPDKKIYPGSPAIIASLLRNQDRALLIEHHPEAIQFLKSNFKKNSQCHIHDRDAIEGLKALLPFPEKRGLIFIDPSYEVKTEYQVIAKMTIQSYQRFPQGIYAIWYPILAENYHLSLIKKIRDAKLDKLWHCEWKPHPSLQKGLQSSGLLIINTPFEVDKLIQDSFVWLNQQIYKNGQFRCEWLF